MSLDEVDKGILRFLQDNARSSFVKIARSLGVSEGTVHLRVRKLLNNGVIRGFYAIVNPERVGLSIRAFIGLQAEPSLYESILKHLVDIDEVYAIYDVTGEYSALLDVKVRDQRELTRIIDEIGGIPGVMATRTMLVLRVVKEEHKLNIP